MNLLADYSESSYLDVDRTNKQVCAHLPLKNRKSAKVLFNIRSATNQNKMIIYELNVIINDTTFITYLFLCIFKHMVYVATVGTEAES